MADIREVKTSEVYAPKGPYSQAVEVGGFLFISGLLPLNAKGDLPGTDMKSQAGQLISNIELILKEKGVGLDRLVKVDVVIDDLKGEQNREEFNRVYEEKFSSVKTKPARDLSYGMLANGVRVKAAAQAYIGER